MTKIAPFFEEKIKGSDSYLFLNKVKSIASQLGYNPNWLMLIMNSETGGTFKSDIKNYITGKAVGLIQFMPNTAIWLGTTTDKLLQMNRVEQLDYVYKYYNNWKKSGKIAKSYEDLYLLTFYPYALDKPDSYIIGSEKSNAYARQVAKQNPFDYNKDGVISKKEFKEFAFKKHVEGALPKSVWKYIAKRNIAGALFLGALATFGIYKLINRKNK